ncbi:unnamed protein product [Blepharisma stoltei]|uniref:Uncharacterized protein n=1 Tax=Blepharisma stoltei TaxID=1481888 RepID=A0AAU9INZ6_9CILI|nr:unnamed protein product [Blepharisma stoltei]
MFSGRCFKENCYNKLAGKCECEGNILFCIEHAPEHFQKSNSKRHQWLSSYIKPADEIKQPIIEKLTELKKDIKGYRNEVIAEASEVIKNLKIAFGKYLDQINHIEKRCTKIIEGLMSGEQFLDVSAEDDMESVLKLNAQRAQLRMAEWGAKQCYLDYREINEVISRTYENPFNPFRKAIEDTIESNELSFFRHNSQNFTTINLDSFQVTSTITLPVQENIHGYTQSCILPDKSYFYFGNATINSGLTFTVDKNKTVRLLQKAKQGCYIDAAFYKNFMYLIGGSTNMAERYDFAKNSWESIAPVPQGLNFSYSCSALLKDSILIAGYYLNKMICYSISQNNYKDVPNLVLNANCHKFMMRGNNRIYLVEKGNRIMESAENDYSSWTQVGDCGIANGGTLQSSIVRYKGSLYSIHYDSQLWKFDLASKQISQVKNV